jgi:hypothetical protein
VGAVSNSKSNFVGAILAIISSIGLFCLVTFTFKNTASYSAQVSFGVTTGHPAWKVFQSRVLGPFIVKALSFGSVQHYGTAHAGFQITTVATAAFLCWRLGKKYGGDDHSAVLALALFVMCFSLLLSPPLLYIWDLIDMIVFTVFIDFILSGFSLPWFLGLFAIAIWNRDSANFIALWLILDPLVRFFYQGRYKLAVLEWHRIFAGAICLGAGLIIAELLKRALFIEGWGPNTAGRYNLGLLWNIDFLKDSLFTFKAWMMALWAWMIVLFLATTALLGAKFASLDPQRYLSIYLIELSLLAALLLFGLIYETRIYLVLVPFIIISGVLVTKAIAVKQARRDARVASEH